MPCKRIFCFTLFARDLLAFLMIPIIQREVNLFKDIVWNTHRIRTQKETVLPSGVTNHIYSFPEEYDLQECGKQVLIFFLSPYKKS